jgi:hypothetical protein
VKVKKGLKDRAIRHFTFDFDLILKLCRVILGSLFVNGDKDSGGF